MKNIRRNLLKVCVAGVMSMSMLGFIACEEPHVTYTFNTNGGATMESITVAEGTEYTLPTPAVREGYEFLGWYATEDLSGAPITTVTASADQTYFAKWEQLCLITLDTNGGTLSQTKVYLKIITGYLQIQI